MENLQELYDFYITTNPSSGKVSAATTMLIHICRALNFDMTEEITPEYFIDIPEALDDFYRLAPNKAIQDKSILAEMIGHYGPRDGWGEVVDILLAEKDLNLRQFTLHSLEIYGHKHPELIIPYLNRFISTSDEIMREVAAHIYAAFLCDSKLARNDDVLNAVKDIKNQVFLRDIYMAILDLKNSNETDVDPELCKLRVLWMEKELLADT
jgi:hypothetical protein